MNKEWKQAIVVGASSGMGAEIARLLGAKGCGVALVARRENELNQVADEVRKAGGQAFVYPHDVANGEEVPALFQRICRDLGGLNILFYTAGVMPRVTPEEYTFEKDRLIYQVNILGAIAWMNEAAQRFAKDGAGTIAGISSVAGDRGRRGQPAYCSSKAALNTYMESLRNRVGRFGVSIVVVKPGPVQTPMIDGLGKQPMMIPVADAAQLIVKAAKRRRAIAYVPGKWRLVMFIIRNIPSFLFKKMKI